MFPPLALVPLVLSKFLAEHVSGQLRHLILAGPCWMEAPWLPTVLNMLVVPRCPIIKDLVVDVLVGQALKGLQISAFNLLAAQWHVLHRQGFSSSVCLGVVGATQMSTSKVYQQCWKEWGSWCAWQGLPNNAISAPKLANFLLHLFQVGLAWHTTGIYHAVISAFFWTLIRFTRLLIILSSQNLCIIFIYNVLLPINILILGMLSICYLFWKVGHQLLLSLPLSWLGRLLLFWHLLLESIVLI